MTFWSFRFSFIFVLNHVGISLKTCLNRKNKIKVRAWTLFITTADPNCFGRGDPTFFRNMYFVLMRGEKIQIPI